MVNQKQMCLLCGGPAVGGMMCRLDIDTSGNITISIALAVPANSNISLDSITFRAAPSP